MQFSRQAFPALALLVVATLAACGGSHRDALPLAFNAALSGAEETPPNASAAAGVGLVTVDADRRTLTASVVAGGMADNAAHLHESRPGVAGPAVFPLAREAGATVWTGRFPLNEAQLSALKAGNYYFNVHSPAFPNGEIRGQVVWALPTPEQLQLLQQVRRQSATVELQLQQVQEIEDDGHWRFTGIGLTIKWYGRRLLGRE